MKLPTRKSIGAVLLIALVSLQCAKLRVLKRHAGAEFSSESSACFDCPDCIANNCSRARMLVTAFAFPGEIKKPTAHLIKELSEKGQQALVEQLGEASRGSVRNPDQDIQRLQKALLFMPAPTPVTVIDKTVFRKKIVVSYDDLNRVPGERFDFTKVTIKIPKEESLAFESWDRIETKYESVDLGKVSATGTSAFSVDATFGSETTTADNTKGTSLSPSFSWSRSLTEDQVYLERFINITGRMASDSITLIRTGAMGQNLDGNVVIEVTIKVDESAGENVVFKLKNLYNDAGVPNKPGDVKVSRIRFRLPLVRKDVKANLSYAYRLRKFQKNTARYAKTIPEFDDKVVFLSSGTCRGNEFTLLKRNELETYFFTLAHQGTTIHYKDSVSGEAKPFLFETYDEAEEVIKWLNALPNNSAMAVVIGASKNEYQLLNGPNTDKPLNWDDKKELSVSIYK